MTRSRECARTLNPGFAARRLLIIAVAALTHLVYRAIVLEDDAKLIIRRSWGCAYLVDKYTKFFCCTWYQIVWIASCSLLLHTRFVRLNPAALH